MKNCIRNREVLAWALYDWANSAFATTVMAGFFPIFFRTYVSDGIPSEVSSFRLGLANSISGLALAVCAPLLAAFADAHRQRKPALALFTLLGAAATAAVAFVGRGEWTAAVTLYGLAAFGFSGAIIFYDSFLPNVSTRESSDEVSGFGYALGYLGGGILFAGNVLMFLKPQLFGLEDGVSAVKAAFLTVAAWWILFSIPFFFIVPEKKGDRVQGAKAIYAALDKLKQTLVDVLGRRAILLFLLAYWVYIDGVNTVIKMAIDFGVSVGLSTTHLIGALLVTQFVGFPSAYVYCSWGRRVGARRMIARGILVYIGAALWAAKVTSVWEFYALAVAIGLVQGGVQALSRSVFSAMVPSDHSAEYFSLFNLVGKFATIVGPALVGTTTYLSGSHRLGISSLTFVFAIGLMLLRLSSTKAADDNGARPAAG